MGLAMLEGKDLLVGKKIVVTGSAGGIGSATVDELVRQGAVVYAIDIKDELGQGLSTTLTARAIRARPFTLIATAR